MDTLDDEVGGPKDLVGGVHARDGSIVAYPGVPRWRKGPVGEDRPGRGLESVPQPLDGGKLVDVSVPTRPIPGIGTLHVPCLPLCRMVPHYNQWITRGQARRGPCPAVGSIRKPEEE